MSIAWHTLRKHTTDTRDVYKTLSHETETVNLQDRDETFQKASRDCLETETFKTEDYIPGGHHTVDNTVPVISYYRLDLNGRNVYVH